MRFTSPILLVVATLGCTGPLMHPMVDRLDPETKAVVDNSWNNMTSPPNRLDRELLLDVVLVNQFHQRGVDRLYFVSEKDVAGGGRVVMNVHFQHDRPELDDFTLTYVDGQGREVRHERYTRQEVEARCAQFFCANAQPVLRADGTPDEEATAMARTEAEARLKERIYAVTAATRPADDPPPREPEVNE